jgi:hypothetical protein
MLAAAQTGPQVTVTTDRGIYHPGEQVRITVAATGLTNDTLWLWVDKPNLHNLYNLELPSTGGVALVELPQDAMAGNYSVAVTWDHQITETSFMVIVQTETQATTTTTATNTMSSPASQTESTSTEPAIEPVNPWPAFALILLVSVFSVVLALAIAKWIRR